MTLASGWLSLVVLLATALLLAGCEDVGQQCPPLAHPPVLTVAAATNPCQAKVGESAALLALRVVRTYQRTKPPAAGTPTMYPLRCGNKDHGYLHLLDELRQGNADHGDPANDPAFDAEIGFTLEHGTIFVQNNNNLRLTAKYDDVQQACHNAWGFRVILATNSPPFPPPGWKSDGLPVGIITAFRLPSQPPS